MKVKIVNLMSFILLFFICMVHSGFGQNYKLKIPKTVWSPPDKSFTVEVPTELKEISGEYADESHTRYNSIKLFGVKKYNYVFQVLVLEVIEEKRKLSSKDKFAGLEFVIGDDNQSFTETFIRIEDLTAKEVVYSNQNKKGLMIDAGDRVYVLALAVKNRKDLNSDTAKRFFTSFHLLHM